MKIQAFRQEHCFNQYHALRIKIKKIVAEYTKISDVTNETFFFKKRHTLKTCGHMKIFYLFFGNNTCVLPYACITELEAVIVSDSNKYTSSLYKSTCICIHNLQHDINEPRCEKTGLRGFRPGPTQTRLYNHSRWLQA